MLDKGAIEPASSSPGFYSRLFLVPKNGGQWRPIIDLLAINAFIDCPSFTMESPRSIISALGQSQWLTSLDLKDTYFQIGIHPADRRFPRFCHNGTWQFRALPFGLATSPRVVTKILKTCTSLRPFTRGMATYVPGWLVVKPGLLSGSSRAHNLAQVPVPKIRSGHKSGEVGFNPFSESHPSGNRARLPCRSGQTIRQESDQMHLHGGGIHSSAVTTRCVMAPSTGTLSGN